jgi:TolB-like protein/Tfp pilus assembly protein PilF
MEVLKKSLKISMRTPKDSAPERATKTGGHVYRFDSFLLSQAERLLLNGDEQVSLTPKVFDTLLVLVENAGHLVTKEKLLEEVWPGTFVEEANLSVNIASLRKALSKGGKQQYIETISKRGYRFTADVVKEVSRSTVNVTPEPPPRLTSQSGITVGASQQTNSLAVLPFENVNKDPNFEYLSDGLTESIINGLSQLQNLRVSARNMVFRYKIKELDPQEIGRKLGVCSVVLGRVLQLNDKLIISTELVDVTNGWQMWGEQYHRGPSDILAVQEEISAAICSKLKARLTHEEKQRLSKYYTDNPEAYHLYLKGRYHWNKYAQQGLRKAIDYFSQAIEIDPTYALAYAGIADSYYRLSNVYAPTTEAMPKAKAAALKALEIDETLAEAHAALGLINMSYDWNWRAAETEFMRAVELNPNYALAHQRLALFCLVQGRFDRALREIHVAQELDPLSPTILLSVGNSFFLMRDYDQALKETEKALEMDNNHQPTLYLLGRIYVQQGKFTEAITIFEKLLATDDAPIFTAALGRAQAIAGQQDIAHKALQSLEQQSKTRYVSGVHKAVVHLALGDKTRTLACLEEARNNRCEMMTWLGVDPAFDVIRRDPRFKKLLRQVGLEREYQSTAS